MNAQESVKSIKMDPEERAFYEGKHLEGEEEVLEDVADVFKRQAEEREQRKAEECANAARDRESGEEGGAPPPKKKKDIKKMGGPGKPKHPFDAVFGDQIAPLIVERQKSKFGKYENSKDTGQLQNNIKSSIEGQDESASAAMA